MPGLSFGPACRLIKILFKCSVTTYDPFQCISNLGFKPFLHSGFKYQTASFTLYLMWFAFMSYCVSYCHSQFWDVFLHINEDRAVFVLRHSQKRDVFHPSQAFPWPSQPRWADLYQTPFLLGKHQLSREQMTCSQVEVCLVWNIRCNHILYGSVCSVNHTMTLRPPDSSSGFITAKKVAYLSENLYLKVTTSISVNL